jgi:hypothetical protein
VCGAFGTFAHQAYTARLRGQLSSNVRPQKPIRAGVQSRSHGKGMERPSKWSCRPHLTPSLNPGREKYRQTWKNDKDVQHRVTSNDQEKQNVEGQSCARNQPVSCSLGLPPTLSRPVEGKPAGVCSQSENHNQRPSMKIHPARLQHRHATSDSGSESQHANLRPSALRPNPSLKLTRYGMQRKPGVRRLRHLRTPGLHCMPPRAA